MATGSAFAKDSCTTGFKSCDERDAWRASVGRPDSPYPSARDVAYGSTFYPYRELACSPDNVAAAGLRLSDPRDVLNANCLVRGAGNFDDYCLFKNAYDLLDKSARLGDQRRSFVILLRQFVEIVKTKRAQDLNALKSFIEANGIDHKLDMAQVRAAIASFSAHARVASGSLGTTMRNFIDAFVAQQILDDSKKDPSFLDVLDHDADGMPRTPAERYTLLMDRAAAADDHEFEDGLTPYYARMILLFHAAEAVSTKSPATASALLSGLARSLSLKINVNERSVEWKNIIPHDGYVLGASAAQGAELLSGHPPGAKSTGIDCSLFIQEGLQSFGITSRMFDYRATTNWMLVPGAIQGLTRRRVCSEKDVQLGDIIVHSGHTFIFAGYTDERKPQLRVIEAVGEGDRTVRDSSIDIYLDDKPSLVKSRKRAGKKSCVNSVLLGSGNDPYYVLEPVQDFYKR